MENAIVFPENIEEISYDWCLGKPAGYLLKKNALKGHSKYGSVSYRCNVGKKQHGKMFSINEKMNEEGAMKSAMEYGINWSNMNGHTKNMIRRVPDGIYWKNDEKNYPKTNNNLEVYLDENHTMLIDFEDLHHIQANAVSKSRTGHENAQYYATFSFKGTREDKKNGKVMMKRVHNHMTGFDMVDHINRNPLDNRRCNLRDTTLKRRI